MQLDWVETAFHELLESGARIAVVYESEGGPSGPQFVVEQAFTQDAALVRQAVLRIGTRHMRPALPRAFDQLGFSANADAHVVMLGSCHGFGPDADSVQAFARTQDITWTAVEHWPPLPAMPREKDGELVNEDPSLTVRGPRLEDLQTLLGDVRFVPAANEAARIEAFREQLAQLTAAGGATDLLVTFVPSPLPETRKATLEVLTRASLAFLKAHPQNRIAIALPGAGVVLPLESNVTRVNAALAKLRRGGTTIAKSTTSADALYEAAGTLAWNAQARRVIVGLDDASWSPFSAQKTDGLRAQHVAITLIGREDSSLLRRWDANDKALLRERCLLVKPSARGHRGKRWRRTARSIARARHAPIATRSKTRSSRPLTRPSRPPLRSDPGISLQLEDFAGVGREEGAGRALVREHEAMTALAVERDGLDLQAIGRLLKVHDLHVVELNPNFRLARLGFGHGEEAREATGLRVRLGLGADFPRRCTRHSPDQKRSSWA